MEKGQALVPPDPLHSPLAEATGNGGQLPFSTPGFSFKHTGRATPMKTSRAQQAAELAALLANEWNREFQRLSPKGWLEKYRSEKPEERPSAEMIATDALALLRIGASVSHWAMRYCNGQGSEWRAYPNGTGAYVWTDMDDAAKEKADARALAKASEIAARYSATVEIGGDPRGYVLRLHLASGRKNGWGDGWGVA